MNWPSLFCLSNSIIEVLEITNPNIDKNTIKTIVGKADYLSEVLKMHKTKV